MTCDQVRPFLEALTARELRWGTARRVRRHLAACPVCESELAETRRLDSRIRAWQDVPAPASLGNRIAAALPDAAPVAVFRRPLAVRRAAVGLAGVAAAGVAFFWLLPGQPGRPTVALADVEQAMASVKTMTEIDDTTNFDKDEKIVAHHVERRWTRRDPSAISRINLSKLSNPGEEPYKQVLEDKRGQMTIMADGSYCLMDDSPENLKSLSSSISISTQTLSFMALLDRRTGKRKLVQGEETVLDGQPVLKFERTWHFPLPTPTDVHWVIWLDSKTRRMIRLEGQQTAHGRLISSGSSSHFRYDETPPAGVFDIVPPPGAKIKDYRVRTNQGQPQP